MPSSFPGSADNIAASKTNATVSSTDHPTHHNDLADGLNAVQDYLLAGLGPAIYNPLEFGATYDGSTDDSAAIQAAIDACSAAGGGIVEISASETIQSPTAGADVKINSSLVLKDSVWLRGRGPQTSLVGTANPMIKLPSSGVIPDRITISDLFLQDPDGVGIELNATGTTGGSQLGWIRLTVQNITVADGVGTSFYAPNTGGPIETRWINCVSMRAGGYGFDVGATDDFFIGCTAAEGSTYGFNIAGGNSKFTACKSYGNDLGNWYVGGGGRHMFVGCESQDAGGHGFEILSENNSFSGCLADTDKRAGFYIGAHKTSIAGCASMYGGGGTGQVTPVGYWIGPGIVNCNIVGTSSCAVPVGGDTRGNTINVNGSGTGHQRVTYAASITPNPYAGEHINVTPLTGNITVNNPVAFHDGQSMTIRLRQDTVGSRTVTWGSTYVVATTLSATANTTTTFQFRFDGARWIEQTTAALTTTYTTGNAPFTAGDSATVVPNATTPSTAWVNVTGTFGISSNQLYLPTAGGSNTGIGYYDFGSGNRDGLVQVTLSNVTGASGGLIGLLLRYVDTSNYLAFTHGGFYEIVSGSARQLSVAGANWSSGDVMAVQLSGPSMVGFQNGTPVISAVMGAPASGTAAAPSSTILASTKHGIYVSGVSGPTTLRFDTLTVTT